MFQKIIVLMLGISLYACGTKDEPIAPTKKAPEPPQSGQSGSNNDNSQTKRPEDYQLVQRARIAWRTASERYYTGFDFKALFIDRNSAKFTCQYLRQFAKLYTSLTDGSQYDFTEEDYQDVVIKSIRYDESSQNIELQFSYKGFTSELLSLPFKLSEYYDRQVTLNPNFASERYAIGFAKHPALFQGDLLNYDEDTYAVTILENSGLSIQDQARTVSFTVRVANKQTNELIVTLQKTLQGFRSLQQLQTDLTISSTAELLTELRPKVATAPDGADLTEQLRPGVNAWIRKAYLEIRGSRLLNAGNGDWVPEQINHDLADLYFPGMRFDLLSARIQGRDLKLRIALLAVHEVVLQDVSFACTVFGVRP